MYTEKKTLSLLLAMGLLPRGFAKTIGRRICINVQQSVWALPPLLLYYLTTSLNYMKHEPKSIK